MNIFVLVTLDEVESNEFQFSDESANACATLFNAVVHRSPAVETDST